MYTLFSVAWHIARQGDVKATQPERRLIMNIGKDNRDHKDIIAASTALVERATKKETIESFLTKSAAIVAKQIENLQKKAEVVYDLSNTYAPWGGLICVLDMDRFSALDDNFSTLRIQVGDAPRDYIDVRSCVPEVTFNDCRSVVVPNDGQPTRDFVLTNDSYKIYKLITPDYTNRGKMDGLMRSARTVDAIRECLDAAERVLDERIKKLAKAAKSWDNAVECILSIANPPKDDNNAK